jgi:glycosyltransferase involved in cell wall biosynthesis
MKQFCSYTDSDVTVVIAVYNGELFLQRAIDSINAQVYPPKEIIAIDDGSTDGSMKLLSKLRLENAIPIRTVRLDRNSGGPVVPMETGIKLSRTPYIALLDQDDEMLPNRLADQRSGLEMCKTAVVCIGFLEKISDSGAVLDPGFLSEVEQRFGVFFGHQLDVQSCVLDRNKARNYAFRNGSLTIASSTMLRKSHWEDLEGFDSDLKIAWDLDFTLKALDRFDMVFVQKRIGCYRVHSGNSSGNKYSCMKDLLKCRSKLVKHPGCGLTKAEVAAYVKEGNKSIAYHGLLNKDRIFSIKCSIRMFLLDPSIENVFFLARTIVKSVLP